MAKRKNIEMSDTETQVEAPATEKKTRKAFVRGPQKVFALLTVTDDQGNELDMRQGKGYKANIELSKDMEGLVTKLLSGDLKAFVVQLEVPKNASADEEEAAA